MPKKNPERLENLKSQAQRIWLAGLGAFAEAEKKGDKLFRSLVKKGKKYEIAVREPIGNAGEALSGSVEAARNQAGKTFKELELAIDRRVAATMQRFGVASRDEVEKLEKEIASLKKALKKSAVGPSKTKAKKKAKAQAKAKAKTKTKSVRKNTPGAAKKTSGTT